MKLPLLASLKGRLLSSGVFPDFQSQSPPLFKQAKNYLFSQGRIQTFLGGQELFSTGIFVPILGVEAFRLQGQRYVFFGTEGNLYLWDESAVTNEGTGYTAQEDETATTLADIWEFLPWGAWAIANNGRDPLQIWKGAGFATITDFESVYGSAYAMSKWGQFLIAFGLEGALDRCAWCANNDPEVWAPTASNLAGSIFFRDLGSRILAALPFQNQNAVLGEDTLNALYFNQATTVFSARLLVKGIGAFGKKAVTVHNGILYGAGPRGVWRSDGSSFNYFHDPAVKKDIYNNLNFEQTSKIQVFFDNQIQALMVMVPPEGQLDIQRGWAYSVEDNSWSPVEFHMTAQTVSGAFPHPILATNSGSIIAQSIYDLGFAGGAEVGQWLLPAPEATVLVGYGRAGYGDGNYDGTIYDGVG